MYVLESESVKISKYYIEACGDYFLLLKDISN